MNLGAECSGKLSRNHSPTPLRGQPLISPRPRRLPAKKPWAAQGILVSFQARFFAVTAGLEGCSVFLPAPHIFIPRIWSTTAVAVWLTLICTAGVSAQAPNESPSARSLAEEEISRRREVLKAKAAELSVADGFLAARKYGEAYEAFGAVLQALPSTQPTAASLRAVAAEGTLRSGLLYSRQLASEADLPGARRVALALNIPELGANDHSTQEWLKALADPDRFPKALDSGHRRRVEQVTDLLSKANSSVELGKWDQANALYDEVLRVDPTNVAARRGMERVEQLRGAYLKTAADQARAARLNEVTAAWEQKPAPALGSLAVADSLATPASAQRRVSIASKLAKWRLNKVDFDQVSLQEVVEYLKVRARDADPEGKGLDFVLAVPAEIGSKTLTLSLSDVPLEEVLRYVTDQVGAAYRIEDFAVRIVSASDVSGELITRTYRVPPGFLSTAAVQAPAAPADPFAQGQAAAGATTIARRMGAREFLESRGIIIAENGSASYLPATNTLTVRTDAKNIELVEALVEQVAGSAPKMALIEVKVMEINGNSIDELGFDWKLGTLGGNIAIGGGTGGNQQPGATFTTSEFPNLAGIANSTLGPVTAGLRSALALDVNKTIESVLYGGLQNQSARSPAMFSLAGVLTDPQFQVVIRGISQKDGVDVVSKPGVIAKSGQKASVEIMREFIYPTEFDPPQIPTNIGGNQLFINGVPQPTSIPPIPVTPTTPTAFDMRRVGMVLEVEPVISEDSKAVDLVLAPELTEFLGFVNYGTPIYSVSTTSVGASNQIELTPNRIFQPIFSRRKITTSVKVYDGATVVLGGAITDQEILIDDEIPVLGKIPFIGRAFQSKVKQRRQKNMLMFVTVRVVDPAGRPVNQAAN